MTLRWQTSRSILSRVSGYLHEAGFTHSLTPARNCTFACTYCYVPTMRVQAGLKPEDWQRWGQFSTVKQNAAELLAGELRPDMTIYCSPLTDPYQPVEAEACIMPGIWRAIASRSPRVFVLQTRGPLVLRDLALLREAAARTTVRVSVSITTCDDLVRRRYEPLCAPIPERLDTIRTLRDAGIEVYATLAPLLPSDPERLVRMAWEASGRVLIADALHVRGSKPRGATTREAAFRILEKHQESAWATPAYQAEQIDKMVLAARAMGADLRTGPPAFGILAR